MKIGTLDRKLLRDLWHLRGQLVTVALIVGCGIATYVTMRGSYESIERAQREYYSSYRFADVFAQLKRAPNTLAAQIASLPGISRVETRGGGSQSGRARTAGTRDCPHPFHPRPRGTRPESLVLATRTLYRALEDREEVLASEAFTNANHLQVGDTIGAVINGRWERLKIVGTALSPEYVYEIRGTEVFPDNRRFGILWMSRDVLGPLFNMEGGFNDVSLTLAPGANEADVIERLDRLLDPFGGLGAYGREDQLETGF